MRIGIVKPDWGIIGGFELVLLRIAQEFEGEGHTVAWFTLDVRTLPRRAFGMDIPDTIWDAQPEFFHYIAMADAFSRLRLDGVDLAISSQPPSYAIRHPRHLALFSHHHRMYYDLCDLWLEGGLAGNPQLHRLAADLLRRVDHDLLRRPTYILAASEVVKDRLRSFNGLNETVGVYHAGVGVPAAEAPADGPGRHAICVSRQEFPKRTELFVHAMKLVPDLLGLAVGGGGRLAYVHSVDARLSRLSRPELRSIDSRALWLSRHDDEPADGVPEKESNVRFVGRVDDDKLRRLYTEALCVVAPAYNEDYGLTAIEAMTHGKPLIVCSDGGGLVRFVEHGVNGMVVDPTGPAIAEAISALDDDPALAEKLGDGARRTAAGYTWERAMREINAGIARVCTNTPPWRAAARWHPNRSHR